MKKHVSMLSIVLIASFVLSACGPGQVFGPTLTPAPTRTPMPTSTPTPLPGPKVGHWEGDPSVSFEIGTDGKMHDFKMEIDLGNNYSCNVTTDNIEIDSEGIFKFTFGETTVEGANVIQGKFETDVTVNGSRSGSIVCVSPSGQIAASLSMNDHPWQAEWKGP